MASRIILFIIGLAALVAAVISFNLTTKHIRGTSGMAWFEAGCSDESGPGKMNCGKVLNSPYSYFPPKKSDQPGGLHIPVAFLGLLYYSALFVWAVGVGRPSPAKRWVHLIPLIFVGIGVAGSAWFIYVMSRVITEWCPWCLVTHGLNFLIAIGLIALWPRRGLSVVPAAESTDGAATPPAALLRHPTNRLLVTTFLAIVFAGYGHLFFFEYLGLGKDSIRLRAEVEALRSNVGGFLAQWQLATPCASLAVPPDDRARVYGTESGPMLDVVVFSDFECPFCAKFAEFFEKRVPPLFDKHIRLSFRHYPLDVACNPKLGKPPHKFACASSILAEAARTVGGTAAFWKAHDYLFAHRDETAAGTMTAEKVAAAVGVDPQALQKAAIDTQALKTRIGQDIEQGAGCGIPGTPAVFVEGKKIDTGVAINPDFWDKLADWYWMEKAKKERPASTKLVKPSPQSPAPPPG